MDEPKDGGVPAGANDDTKVEAQPVAPAPQVAQGRPSRVPYELINAVMLTIGSLISALAFNLFLVPSNTAPGGLVGVAIVVSRFVSVPNGLLLLALHAPLLYLGFRALGGGRFLLRTVYVVLITTVAIDLTAPFLPDEGLSSDPLLNALYGGAVLGAAAALIMRAYGNVGGTSILARILQRRTGLPMGQIYLMTDGLIVLMLGATFGWERALYSMLALFVYGIAVDYVIEGPSIVRTVFIVTDHPREMAAALQTRLRTGVTAWRGEGMYRRGERTILFCTVNRSEVRELTRIVREMDHEGFMVVGQGQRAKGGTIGRSDAPG